MAEKQAENDVKLKIASADQETTMKTETMKAEKDVQLARMHNAALIEVEPIDIAEEPDTPSKLLTSHTSERFPQQRP